MDEPALPLVLTKLSPPAARPRMVHRARLQERLATEPGTSLVLVCAPAGYGKTTLLADWARSFRQSGGAVAWFAIDSSDDDPLPFSAYLVASLAQALGPKSGLAQAAHWLRSTPEIDLQRILPAVINAAAAGGRECALILDDYQWIGAPAIHTALAYLVEHLPGNLRVWIGSRSDPPLPLARLRAQGRLLEIRAADLRFTPDETAQFLNDVMQLELPVDTLAALEARTEGWVAGLQLAALSLSGSDDKAGFLSTFTGGHRYLVEYLLEEVFNRQPREVQDFLLSTSILERLCASLCESVYSSRLTVDGEKLTVDGSQSTVLREATSKASELSTVDCQLVLETLDHSNLFLIPLDTEQRWYRYHPLFRDFLQTRLERTQPERVTRLQRAASQWHEAHGSLRDAVRHALQTHDWDFAADIVERHAITMMAHSEFATVYEWCAAFPEEVMRARPPLCIFQGYALVLGYRSQNRGRIEERAQQIEQAAAVLEDRYMAQVLTGQAVTMRTLLAAMTPDSTVDPRSQLSQAQAALNLLTEDDPARSAMMLAIGYAHMALHDASAATRAMEEACRLSLTFHIYYCMVEAVFHRARLAHQQGQLRRAVDICRQGKLDLAASLPHPEQEMPALGSLDIALGCVLLEQDQLAGAEAALLHGLELVGWWMNPFHQLTACVALFRLYEIQGRLGEGMEILHRLEEAWPDISFCPRGIRAAHDLIAAPQDAKARAAAEDWCQEISPTLAVEAPLPGMGPYGAAEATYLAHLDWARIQIALGKPQVALELLQHHLVVASVHGLRNRLIELSLLEAQALRAQDKLTPALEALERALAAAQLEGYLRIFDQGPALFELLVVAAPRSAYRETIARILAVIGPPVAAGGLGQERGGARTVPMTPSPLVAGLEWGERLSQRELEVLHLMASGSTNQAIAEQLVITVGTVKSHINHILDKLGAHNRTEAVARARGLGLLNI